LSWDRDRAFKFLAIDEVESVEIVAMAVGIMPFLRLYTSSSAKNLKAACEMGRETGMLCHKLDVYPNNRHSRCTPEAENP
jgi:methionine salvage enolase-phosphatase E1